MTSYIDLPPDLPRPVDDGACDHLPGLAMPTVRLPSTAGRLVDLGALRAPRTVIYCYPRTGRPGEPLPDGWDMIPGARAVSANGLTNIDNFHFDLPSQRTFGARYGEAMLEALGISAP